MVMRQKVWRKYSYRTAHLVDSPKCFGRWYQWRGSQAAAAGSLTEMADDDRTKTNLGKKPVAVLDCRLGQTNVHMVARSSGRTKRLPKVPPRWPAQHRGVSYPDAARSVSLVIPFVLLPSPPNCPSQPQVTSNRPARTISTRTIHTFHALCIQEVREVSVHRYPNRTHDRPRTRRAQ